MSSHHDTISDTDFIRAFEDLSLDPAYFDHVGHLRLACLYLQANSLEAAIEKTCDGIRAYAASLGASMKFHRTISTALVKIIAARNRAGTGVADWQSFIEANRDLSDDGLSVLGQYYSRERLFSDAARACYLAPDQSDGFCDDRAGSSQSGERREMH